MVRSRWAAGTILDDLPGTYIAKQGWSPHAALAQLGEKTGDYNVNFNRAVDVSGGCYPPNSTVLTTKVNTFLCPSDPNNSRSGDGDNATNDYVACLGSSTNLFVIANGNTSLPSFAAAPSSGLFAWQQSYALNSVLDGTSNTLAFGESAVGAAVQAPKQKNIGVIDVLDPGGSPGARRQVRTGCGPERHCSLRQSLEYGRLKHRRRARLDPAVAWGRRLDRLHVGRGPQLEIGSMDALQQRLGEPVGVRQSTAITPAASTS